MAAGRNVGKGRGLEGIATSVGEIVRSLLCVRAANPKAERGRRKEERMGTKKERREERGKKRKKGRKGKRRR